MKEFGQGDRVFVQSKQIWPILTGIAVLKPSLNHNFRNGLVTYGQLAEITGRPPQAGRTLDKALGIIHRVCAENGLPILNQIVVNAKTGVPGDYDDGDVDFEKEVGDALEFPWFKYRIPTIRYFKNAKYGYD
tara:strand:+ start:958 stop:1353 length:396 start_codon:yes stop_codon:yes gene_type:complete